MQTKKTVELFRVSGFPLFYFFILRNQYGTQNRLDFAFGGFADAFAVWWIWGIFLFRVFSLSNMSRRHEKECEIRGKFIKPKMFCVTHPKNFPLCRSFPKAAEHRKKVPLWGWSSPATRPSSSYISANAMKRLDGSIRAHVDFKKTTFLTKTKQNKTSPRFDSDAGDDQTRPPAPTRAACFWHLHAHAVQVCASDLPIDGKPPASEPQLPKSRRTFTK